MTGFRQWLRLFLVGLFSGLPMVQAGIRISVTGSVAGIEANVRNLLAGAGVTIRHVNVLRLAGVDQWGTFRRGTADASPNIGIDQGIVISTGQAYTIESSYKDPYGYSYGRENFDSDLGKLLESTAGQYDSVIITFDIIPDTDRIAIDFVYGSDEYEKYVNTGYVDAFGIFVSGPGIQGQYSNQAVNLVELPNGTPVIGKHVNQFRNTGYYIRNPAVTYDSQGYSSYGRGDYIALNGWTKRVTGSVRVKAGKTYQVKIALGEGQDGHYDTSVFLTPFISDRKKNKSSINVMVWHDLDGNERRDEGEPPLEGVMVKLVPENDSRQITSKSTDSSGSARFENVADGGYWLEAPTKLDLRKHLYLGVSTPSPHYVNVRGSDHYNASFGYIDSPAVFTLVPVYRQSTAPGFFVRFSHILTSSTSDPVTLSTQWMNDEGTLDKGAAGAWPVTLEKLDCNSDTQQGTPITGFLLPDPGQPLCFQAVFFVPEETPQGIRSSLAINASIEGSDGDRPVAEVRVINQVTVSDKDSGRLLLEKTVATKTLDGVKASSSESSGSSEGGSGDVLIYTIRFRNIGAGALNTLKILDQAPAFTHLSKPAACPLAEDLPTGLGACRVQTTSAGNDKGFRGQIIWHFDGILAPGAGGYVSYELMVE